MNCKHGVKKMVQTAALRLYNRKEEKRQCVNIRVAIDIAGPLPEMDSGNKYILGATAYFSKRPTNKSESGYGC